ncbi:response regulator [Dyadobacter bucti]|uniref:response regulator n=1 Tax=Dyadobacter bucti TaxID=2572203 RepID=UPI0011084B7A|nr:response regulator [Dyadobacter bucti]
MEFILIDDSVFDLLTEEKLLLKSGLTDTVKSFSSAQEAIKFLKEQTGAMPETVILLDLQMPEINGFEFTRHFAEMSEEMRKRIRIYMISSTVDSMDIEEARDNPYIIELLSKPLEIPVLRSLLGE